MLRVICEYHNLKSHIRIIRIFFSLFCLFCLFVCFVFVCKSANNGITMCDHCNMTSAIAHCETHLARFFFSATGLCTMRLWIVPITRGFCCAITAFHRPRLSSAMTKDCPYAKHVFQTPMTPHVLTIIRVIVSHHFSILIPLPRFLHLLSLISIGDLHFITYLHYRKKNPLPKI